MLRRSEGSNERLWQDGLLTKLEWSHSASVPPISERGGLIVQDAEAEIGEFRRA
jgi:hypothetical protein